MLSKNIKRKIAVLLTGVMVFGMTVSAGAAVTGTAVESEGSGNFEGHVNRKVVDVTLPTVSEGTAPFSFIYDAEGLIKETAGAAYGSGYDFEEGTLVYFKTGDKEFKKDSTEFTVSNNSSVSVNVTLKIDVTAGDNDPNLVGSAEEVGTGTEDANLFLGLVVGGDATGAEETATSGTFSISGNTVSKTFNLLGQKGNYSVSTNEVGETAPYPHTYTFKKNEPGAEGWQDWKKITFKLTGKANKVDVAKKNDALLTAPNLKVTWNFAALDEDAELVNNGSSSGGSSSGGSTTPTPAYALVDSEYSLWLAKDSTPTPFSNLTAMSQVTKFTVNGKNVLSKAEINGGYLVITWANAESCGCEPAADGKYVLVATIDGVTYEGTYQQ